jgi:hypothetical protein
MKSTHLDDLLVVDVLLHAVYPVLQHCLANILQQLALQLLVRCPALFF